MRILMCMAKTAVNLSVSEVILREARAARARSSPLWAETIR